MKILKFRLFQESNQEWTPESFEKFINSHKKFDELEKEDMLNNFSILVSSTSGDIEKKEARENILLELGENLDRHQYQTLQEFLKKKR